MSCESTAQAILAEHTTVLTFCERCGDRVPGVPFTYTGGTLDLTTTYVKTTADRYENLATLAGCWPADATPTLHVDHDHGELITVPDGPERPEVPAHAIDHARDTPIMIVEAPNRDANLIAGLASAGTATAAIAMILAVRAIRRRRAHRPRL